MNTALIMAAGSGQRMNSEIPKQFINIQNKPVLIYTLLGFQNHPEIDQIAVVCLDGWEVVLKAYTEHHNINKLVKITKGGDTVQESIRNGVLQLEDICQPEDIVIIHDGIRPLVDESVLSDVIEKCKTFGNGVSSLPYNEQIFIKNNDFSTSEYIPRENLRRVVTPQAYKYGKLLWAYNKAFTEQVGIFGSSYTNTMMVDLGEVLFFAKGSDKNIKLTNQDDLAIITSYLED